MLIGSKVKLRAPISTDIEFLFKLRNDIEIQMSLMSLPRANTRERVNNWIAGILNDPDSVFFIISEYLTDKPIGFIQLTKMNFIHGTASLGICLDKHAQGKGNAKEAFMLLSDYAANVFAIRKIQLEVLSSNSKAKRFYDKVGFGKVGIRKREFYQNQAYHDVLIMEKFLNEEDIK